MMAEAVAIVGASLAGSSQISLEQCQWDQSPHYEAAYIKGENPGKERKENKTQIPFLLSFGSFVPESTPGNFKRGGRTGQGTQKASRGREGNM